MRPNWTDADTRRAQEIWADYQRHHDISDRIGQTAGIDPVSGRIWFGESAGAICKQQDAEGPATPLYFVRVGRGYYYRKGGHR